MKRTLLLWIGAPLVMLVGLGVILDLYCELVGLPDIGRRACQQWLEGRGIACDTKHIRMGVIGGVTVDNLTLWDRTRPGKRVLVADHVRWRPDLSALLTGTLRHGRLIVENGTLYVPVPRKEGTGTAGERQELTLSEVSLEAEITSHVLTLDVSASLEGIQLQFAGQLSGFGKARQAETDGRKPHPLGWQPALDRLPEKGGAALRWIRRFTSTYLLVEDDAFVNATFNIDLQHPGSNYVAGKLQLADMVLRNVPIRKCKAQFQLDAHRLALDRATVYLGVGSKVAGSVRMNIAERVLAATAAGTLDPHLLYRFLGRPMPRFLAEATFPTPPVITAELEPSPLAPEEWKWQCDFEVENSVYRREFIRHAEGTLRRTPGSLVADGLQVRFDAAGREVVTGRVQYEEASGRVAAMVKGAVYPKLVLRALPRPVPSLDRLAEDLMFHSSPPEVRADLRLGGEHAATWEGTLTVSAKDLAYRDQQITAIYCPLTFKEGCIKTEQTVSVQVDAEGTQYVRLNGAVNVTDKTIRADGKAAVFPVRLYRALRLPENRALDGLAVKGDPLMLSFELEESPWAPREWRGTVDVEASTAALETLVVDGLKARMLAQPGTLRFEHVTMEPRQAEKLTADYVAVGLKTGEVEMAGEFIGDPRLLQVFVAPGRSRKAFNNVWADVTWGKKPPHFNISQLYFYDIAPGEWRLTMDCHTEAEGVLYRGLDLDELSVDVTLQLPAGGALNNIAVVRGDENITGTVELELRGNPVATFDCKGRFDPVHAFSTVSEGLEDALDGLSMGTDTETTISGAVQLRGKPRPRLQGSLAGSSMGYGPLKFNAFNGEFRLVDSDLKWSLKETAFCEGLITANGLHNNFFGTGRLDVETEEVSVAALIAQLQGKPYEKKLGVLNGEASVEMYRQNEEKPWQLDGGGEIRMREGNLWELPVLDALGETLGFGAVGRISSLDATLQFKGYRLDVPKVSTNGTILALNGSGFYEWSTDKVNFKVYGEALKGTTLVPKVLKPVSWMLEAELIGTLQEYQWRPLGPLRRMLPGGGSDE